MRSFVKDLLTSGGSMTFYFNEVTPITILVSVVGRRNKTFLFYFHWLNKQWKAAEEPSNCPSWSSDFEALLGHQIMEESRPDMHF